MSPYKIIYVFDPTLPTYVSVIKSLKPIIHIIIQKFFQKIFI